MGPTDSSRNVRNLGSQVIANTTPQTNTPSTETPKEDTAAEKHEKYTSTILDVKKVLDRSSASDQDVADLKKSLDSLVEIQKKGGLSDEDTEMLKITLEYFSGSINYPGTGVITPTSLITLKSAEKDTGISGLGTINVSRMLDTAMGSTGSEADDLLALVSTTYNTYTTVLDNLSGPLKITQNLMDAMTKLEQLKAKNRTDDIKDSFFQAPVTVDDIPEGIRESVLNLDVEKYQREAKAAKEAYDTASKKITELDQTATDALTAFEAAFPEYENKSDAEIKSYVDSLSSDDKQKYKQLMETLVASKKAYSDYKKTVFDPAYLANEKAAETLTFETNTRFFPKGSLSPEVQKARQEWLDAKQNEANAKALYDKKASYDGGDLAGDIASLGFNIIGRHDAENAAKGAYDTAVSATKEKLIAYNNFLSELPPVNAGTFLQTEDGRAALLLKAKNNPEIYRDMYLKNELPTISTATEEDLATMMETVSNIRQYVNELKDKLTEEQKGKGGMYASVEALVKELENRFPPSTNGSMESLEQFIKDVNTTSEKISNLLADAKVAIKNFSEQGQDQLKTKQLFLNQIIDIMSAMMRLLHSTTLGLARNVKQANL